MGILGVSVGSLRDLRALRGAPWGAWRRSLGALGFVLGSLGGSRGCLGGQSDVPMTPGSGGEVPRECYLTH